MILEILTGAMIILALGLVGHMVLRLALGHPDWLLSLSLCYPIGSGVFTLSLFFMGWLGIRICKTCVMIEYGALLLVLLIVSTRVTHPRQSTPVAKTVTSIRQATAATIMGWAVFSITLAVAYAVSLGRSYSSWDGAANYATKGYAIAASGSLLAVQDWGFHGSTYPLNIPLQIALFKLFGNELVPASKLIFPTFLLAGCLGAFRFWRILGVKASIATIGIVLVSSNPVLLIQSTNGYVDSAFAVVYVLACITCIEAVLNRKPALLIIGALLMGIAAWSRPEGLAYTVTGLATISLLGRLRTGQKLNYFPLAVAVVPFSLWLLFPVLAQTPQHLGDSINALDALGNLRGSFLRGDFNLGALIHIPLSFSRRALEPQNWGMLLPFLILSIAAGCLRRRFRAAWLPYLTGACAVAVALPFAIYYVISFSPFNDFELMLRTSFDRAALPAFLMLSVMAVSLFADASDPHPVGEGARGVGGAPSETWVTWTSQPFRR